MRPLIGTVQKQPERMRNIIYNYGMGPAVNRSLGATAEAAHRAVDQHATEISNLHHAYSANSSLAFTMVMEVIIRARISVVCSELHKVRALVHNQGKTTLPTTAPGNSVANDTGSQGPG